MRRFLFILGTYLFCDPCRLLAYEVANHSVEITDDIVQYLDAKICGGNKKCNTVVETATKLFVEKLSDPSFCTDLNLCSQDPDVMIDKMVEYHMNDTAVGDIIKNKIL